MAPNGTADGSSRFGVPDKTTTSGDDLTSTASGDLLKTSGGAPDPSEVILKKPASDGSAFSGSDSSSDSSSGGDGSGFWSSVWDAISNN